MSEHTEHSDAHGSTSRKGPLAWMAQNSVAANLLMVVLMVGGFLMIFQVTQEVFPEVQLDVVTVQVPYPGASPEEVEQGIVLAVEEAVRGIDGVKEVRSTAREGMALVTAELLTDANPDRALNDIKSGVDRITSFPEDAERPVISLASNRRQVISLVLAGDVDRRTLDRLAEQVRDDLLTNDNITVVEVSGIPAPEISIDIPQENLRRYGLTMQQVARAVGAASIELPGGGVKTPSGEVLLRTSQRRETAQEYAKIPIISRPGGTEVTLGEIADIEDTYREDETEAYYNGKPAARVEVYRVGDQTPIEIADAVRDYVEQKREELPEGIEVAVWNDQSEIYRDRVELLIKNALLGLLLVLVLLGLFLQIRLAFWVTLGIPISFLGAFLFMPALDVSINMISLFAFILSLGIVVDDAIVVGEAVFKHRQEGMGPIDAAIAGVREVAMPVTFAVLTTVTAFAPLLFVPGVMGKFFSNIPLIVIPVFLISLVEGLFILPAHLAHSKDPSSGGGILGRINRLQDKFSQKVERFVENVYQPAVVRIIEYRYATLAVALGLLLLTVGVFRGGLVKFIFFPKIEGDEVRSSLEMPFGTPIDDTREVARSITAGASRVFEELGATEASRGIYSVVGAGGGGGGGPRDGAATTGTHLAQVEVSLVGADRREFTSREFARLWREQVGEVPGAQTLTFDFNLGPSAGTAVNVELSHANTETLERAAARLADELEEYAGVYEIDEGFRSGKRQIDLELTPGGRALGLNEMELAQQVRGNFFGAEAVRQQRGRDELRVYVRRPRDERASGYDIDQMIIRTPQGGEIPLSQAANLDWGRSFTTIEREEARRVVNVTADVDTSVTTGNEVTSNLQEDVLPELLADYPGLTYEMAGEQEEQRESLGALGLYGAIALLIIYGLMAMVFRSYVQPIIIMFAIPFGIVGAVAGHLLMGYDLSLMSIMGIVALAGVVVNDSLVLIAAVNDYRREGQEAFDAVVNGGMRRFRPVLLTSLTTFFGLAPMILETSVQARFLIPMAVSLGFGVLFVTFIALAFVPASYMAIEDVKRLLGMGGIRD